MSTSPPTDQSAAPLRCALIQQQYRSDADNTQQLNAAIADAVKQGAELVVLPELHESRYFCQSESPAVFDLAEPIPGPTSNWLAGQAKQHGCVIIGSIFERRAAGLYHNTAVVLERDGRLVGRYRKMHIPDDPAYYEKFYFTPGDYSPDKHDATGFHPVDTSVGRLGVLVCWDQWFPEGARLMALAGAELLIYPTAIGYSPSEPADEQQRQRQAWQLVQRGHAVANGLPVLACNRCGFEAGPADGDDGLDFWGGSFIAGPQGELLAEAADQPTVLIADIDRQRAEDVRRMWPFLRDRRVEAYGELSKRYRN